MNKLALFAFFTCIVFVTTAGFAQTSVVYDEDFESIGTWTVEGGNWEVGPPTSGPGAAHAGANLAATVLDGDYENSANARLILPSIALSANPQDGAIWLRFWQWYYDVDSGDYGRVQVSVDGGAWTTLDGSFIGTDTGNWTQALYDLSAFAGQDVRVAFQFVSNGGTTFPGWYVDDVSVEEGALTFENPEGFEDGIGDIAVEGGSWTVGVPTAGPGAAHTGLHCAGTVVDGDYPNYADARMVLPPLDLSASPADGQIWLRFWQWYYDVDSGDYGQVEVSADGGAWTFLPGSSIGTESGDWTQALYDLSPYAGQTIRIAFRFISNAGTRFEGWYVDDVSVEEGVLTFENPEGFEDGIGDVAVEGGAWTVGVPTTGPTTAHGGTQCAGTIVDGNYPNYANARMILPPLELSASPEDGEIWLRFWQWYHDIDNGDYGRVEVSADGGAWTSLTGSTVNTESGNWTQALYDLSPYAGQTIRIAFRFIANAGTNYPGWYVDDVSVEEGALTFENPEGFEDGIGDVAVEGGAWTVGVPTTGPTTAHGGTQCAGTIVDGNYPNYANARMILPPIDLSASPVDGQVWLRFWQWYHDIDSGDYGQVEVSADGGAWTVLPGSTMSTESGDWTQALYDLSGFKGQTVRVAFRFVANAGTNYPGWYVDDVSVEEGALIFENPEGFEDGIGDIAVQNGSWTVGVPTVGPEVAHSGTQCAGTIVDGNYPNYASARMVLPPVELSATPSGDQVWLRFWQWYYDVDSGDYGQVEVSADGGAWVTLPGSTMGTDSGDWTQALYDLSSFQGQTVRVAFHFIANAGTNFAGWYVDDVSIEEGALVFENPEGFEDGIGDIAVEGGSWTVGDPTSGPGNALSGKRCAGTIVDGNYPNYANARMILPPIALSATPEGDAIWLRFWQWYHDTDNGDYGQVEVSAGGGAWTLIPDSYVTTTSGDWTQALYDLTAYAGQTVRIAFRFISNAGTTFSGWYVDEISIEEGGLRQLRPIEDFERLDPGEPWSSVRDFQVVNGVWDMGIPIGAPGSTHSGQACAGTALVGDVPILANCRLVSPAVQIEPTPLGGQVWLRYWQWYYAVDTGDYGRVALSADGGPWQVVDGSRAYIDGSDWTQAAIDLSAYAGQSVRFSFQYISNGGTTFPGWYLDEVSVAQDPMTHRGAVVGFEEGMGSWYTEGGVWQAGTATAGPVSAGAGDACVGTNLSGNYPYIADARLVSPPIALTPVDGGQPVQLDFLQWRNLAGGVAGTVEIAVDGGAWQTLATFTGTSSDQWVALDAPIDLTSHAGSTVQLSFRLSSPSRGVAPGWYLDEISLSNLDRDRPNAPTDLAVTYFDPSTLPGADAPEHTLSWNAVADPDVAYYAVYRGYDADFVPDFSHRIALTATTTFADADGASHEYHYKVSAVDTAWNESAVVSPGTVTAVGGSDEGAATPSYVALHGNVPNPFNPTTRIHFDMPTRKWVRLDVYDASGRHVRRLVDRELAGGRHFVAVDGSGWASGVYFYRLEVGGEKRDGKMVLVK